MTDVETTQQLTRGEAADYLRQFADQLDDRPTDPLTAGLYETDGEPADTSPTAPVTDTSTRGRTETPMDEASTRDGGTDTTGTAGTTGAGAAPDPEADGGAGTEGRTGDETTSHGSVRDGRVTILVGNDSATVNPPSQVDLAVAVGTDDSLVTSGGEQFVSFELTWEADAVDDEETLDIE